MTASENEKKEMAERFLNSWIARLIGKIVYFLFSFVAVKTEEAEEEEWRD